MRNLLLLLLLCNLLVYAWQHWIIKPDMAPAALNRQADVPSLFIAAPTPQVLQAPAIRDTDADVAGSESVPAQPLRCARLGPFSGASDAREVERNLTQRGVTVRQTSEEGRVWVGHWVQVGGLRTREQAEAARVRLVAAGKTDAYIIAGTDEPLISLGVFRARISAERAMRDAQALGFAVRMEDRYQPGTQLWLWLQLRPDADIRVGEFNRSGGQILRLDYLACADAGF